jgi:hypothetical protein
MVSRRSIALAALLLCAAAGCSSSAKPPACGTRDAGVIEVGLEPPPGCPPAEANELGIGKPCTMCGNECASPLRCTCDSYLGVQLSGVPCVCTMFQLAPTGSTNPCGDVGSSFCGSNATCCNVLQTAAYCVPNVCLINQQCIEFVPLDGGTDSATD